MPQLPPTLPTHSPSDQDTFHLTFHSHLFLSSSLSPHHNLACPRPKCRHITPTAGTIRKRSRTRRLGAGRALMTGLAHTNTFLLTTATRDSTLQHLCIRVTLKLRCQLQQCTTITTT